MKTFALLIAGFASCAIGQRLDPVQWSLESEATKVPQNSSITLKLTAKLQDGWHLYSLTTPKGGPIPTTAGLADNPAIAAWTLFQPKPERRFDPNFSLDTETFEK